jgi:hypothetical protein
MPEIYKGINNSVWCTYIFFCFIIKVQIFKRKKIKSISLAFIIEGDEQLYIDLKISH